jgi:hypothetical protein
LCRFYSHKILGYRWKIISFFDKYPLIGNKKLDYLDFGCKAAELIKNKAHLTSEGLEEILRIKASPSSGGAMQAARSAPAGMNTGRKLDLS